MARSYDLIPNGFLFQPSLSPYRIDRRIDEQFENERGEDTADHRRDRKSTRLNSSHGYISYAVFCLKKKNIVATSPRRWTSPFSRNTRHWISGSASIPPIPAPSPHPNTAVSPGNASTTVRAPKRHRR